MYRKKNLRVLWGLLLIAGCGQGGVDGGLGDGAVARANPPVSVRGSDETFLDALSTDECNTTGQCREIHGDRATDCLNSRSDTSVCMCGAAPCDAEDSEPPPTSPDPVEPPPPPTSPDPVEPPAPPRRPVANGSCRVRGDLKEWHRVVLECNGPLASEGSDDAFLDYRMDVIFSSGGTSITVPGHFAADGDAAESGATSGSIWRAYFTPTAARSWNYRVRMVQGDRVALTGGGSPVDGIDGSSGRFSVGQAGRLTRDMRSRGLLEHRPGERYLRFRRNGEVFIDAGANSPENLLGFSDFDNTEKFDDGFACKGILHDFAPHVRDWAPGDPAWRGGKGRGLIGLVNYLSSKNVNAMYFIGMNVRGDGCDTYPWSDYDERFSFDVSKLDQWEIVFEHMQRRGIFIHYVTQETENDQLLDGGDLGDSRRLYYREIISRFGHHPALQWNLGEENTNTLAEQKSFANYFRAIDPYNHPVVIHTYPRDREAVYAPLLGFENLDGPTLQIGGIPSTGDDDLYEETRDWVRRSANSGAPWVVTVTEASGGDAPEPGDAVTKLQRVNYMWANVMAGGGGFEWYLKETGSDVEHAFDLAAENLRELDDLWTQTGHVSSFFTRAQRNFDVDLGALEPANELASNDDAWVLADEGRSYIVFLREGGSTDLTLAGGNYTLRWFNPRSGALSARSNVRGDGRVALGEPPSQTSEDWVILVRRASP